MGVARSPKLIGRASQMQALLDELERARGGNGRSVVIFGEAGIGKSRLIQEFGTQVGDLGVRLLSGRSTPASVTTPFRSITQAMQSEVRPSDLEESSVRPFRSTISQFLGWDDDDSNPKDASSISAMEAITRTLRVIVIREPCVMILEDIHWADPDTISAIEYLSDKFEDLPLLIVATLRPEVSSNADEVVSSLIYRRAAERIELPPLSDSEVSEMARSALNSTAIPRSLEEALATRAAGVPFLVEEMLAAYLEAGGLSERIPEWWLLRRISESLPRSFREVIVSRLEKLGTSTKQVIFAASVLGRTFDWKLIAYITALSEPEVLQALRESVRNGLVTSGGDHYAGAFAFRHALAREAVLAELLPPERQDLSRRAAVAIEDAYPNLSGEWCGTAARLYIEANEPIEGARLLQELARRALNRSAFNTAEDALLHARDLAGSDWMLWMGIDDLLLQTYTAAGRTDKVLDCGRRLIAVYEERYSGLNVDERIADVHLRTARGAMSKTNLELVDSHLKEAESLARSIPNKSISVEVLALRSRLELLKDEFESARLSSMKTASAAEKLNSPQVKCEALDVLTRAELRLGDLDRAVEVASELNEFADHPKLTIWKIRGLRQRGAIDVVTTGDKQRLILARDLAISAGAMAELATVELNLAWHELGLGRAPEAEEYLSSTMDSARSLRLPVLGEGFAALCMLHAISDEKELLEVSTQEGLAASANPSEQSDVVGNGPAVLHLVRGDDEAALGFLDQALEIGEGDTQPWWRGLHALLHVALANETPALDRFVASQAMWHPMNRAYLSYARALIEGRSGQPDRAETLMKEADSMMVPGWRLHHARLVVANAALDDGWGDPATWAGDAMTFFDRVFLPGLVAACRRTLRRAGAPVRRRGRGISEVPDALKKIGITSREMDILILLADQLSNQAIGERLFLSPRTVENHVASLLRKTGSENRGALIELGRRQVASTS